MDTKAMSMALAAAAMFAVGGLFMKPASGMTRVAPSACMLVLFLGGAVLNALVVNRGGELGVAYLLVVGCETLLAFGLGVAVFHERVTPTRIVAMLLVACGALLLASSEHAEADSHGGGVQLEVNSSPADIGRPIR